MKTIAETKNYIIRETAFADYEYFSRWEIDQDVTKFLAYDITRTYEDVVEECFGNKADASKADFTIVAKASDQPIGRIYLSRIDDHSDSVDITKIYIGDKSLWNQGVGREVMEGLLKYLFEDMKMERITLDYFTGNVRAASLYKNLGFVSEGLARNACKKDDVYHDLNLMSMLREEYIAR